VITMLNHIKRKLIIKATDLYSKAGNSAGIKGKNGVLLLPPHGFGSIGDEAMVISAVQNFKSRYGLNSDILAFSSEGGWKDRVEHINGFHDEIVIDGKFGDPFNTRKLISIISEYKVFAVVGADIMDGAYSILQSCKRFILLRQAARMGVKSILLGSSFNKKIPHEVTQCLAELSGAENVKINARDELSYKRINMICSNSTPVMDCAFLLNPIKMDDEISDFAEANDFVAVNINSIHYKKYGEFLIDQLASDIEKIITELSLSVVLTPHDIREDAFDAPSDLTLCKKVYEKINPCLYGKLRVVDNRTLLNASYLKWLASKAKLVVTGRMHFAIAALGSGTPALCMTYQDKFEGMLSVFSECKENFILSDYPRECDSLINKLNKFVSDDFNIKQSIDTGLMKARVASFRNYEL